MANRLTGGRGFESLEDWPVEGILAQSRARPKTVGASSTAVFERLAQQGFDDLRPAHAQVFQQLDEDGVS